MAKHLTIQELRNLNREKWFIRTYCTKEQIEEIIDNDDRVLWWRAIIHDKDTKEDNTPKETHAHIVIEYKNRIKGSTVYNCFKGYKDEKGKEINTEIQECNRKAGCYYYLTHNTEKAKKEGKHLYDENEIFGNGEINLEEENNSKYVNLINEIRNNAQPLELVMKYGMLYITNIKNLKKIAEEQTKWENNKKFEEEFNTMVELAIMDEKLVNAYIKSQLEQTELNKLENIDILIKYITDRLRNGAPNGPKS